MNKCASCGQKKAKRACPALNQSICPQCCGQKRGLVIPCYEDCLYFHDGSSRQIQRHITRRIQTIDAKLTAKVYQELFAILEAFHKSIVGVRHIFKDVKDSQILDAIQKFRQTCQTESKGLIYEQTSSDPTVQSLLHTLSAAAKEIRQGIKDEIRHEFFSLDDILDCLNFIEADIGATQQETRNPNGYTDYLTQLHPLPSEDRQQSRIILP